MLSPLTKEQRMKVEENMGLVGKVIQDCVHTLGAGSMFDYDDLFQIGCLGLCKIPVSRQKAFVWPVCTADDFTVPSDDAVPVSGAR